MQHPNYIIVHPLSALGQLTAPEYADVAHVSGAGSERERGRGWKGEGRRVLGEKWRPGGAYRVKDNTLHTPPGPD